MKVYRLPLGNPQARGKAMVNLLPLDQGETISTVMPLPEDEASWGDSHVMFATASGQCPPQYAVGFRRHPRQRQDRHEARTRRRPSDRRPDLHRGARRAAGRRATANASASRSTDVRVFKGRDLDRRARHPAARHGDEVISHVDVAPCRIIDSEIARCLSARGELRGASEHGDASSAASSKSISCRSASNGFGKRTSAYEYRITGRGGSGIANIDLTEQDGPGRRVLPGRRRRRDHAGDRCRQADPYPVDGVRIAGRKTQGVMLLRTAEDERVVSAARLGDVGERNGDDGDDGRRGGRGKRPPKADGQGEEMMAAERIGIYPGTFDPITYGHQDIIQRASRRRRPTDRRRRARMPARGRCSRRPSGCDGARRYRRHEDAKRRQASRCGPSTRC